MSHRPGRSRELEGILDDLVQSYAGPEAINNLETAALPNRRKVVSAFAELRHVLFMGFFSTRRLEPANLRLALTEHLLPAYECLVDQIDRAVTYEDRRRPPEERRPPGWSAEVVLSLLRELPRIRRQLEGDVIAAWAGDPAAESIEEIVFSYPSVLALTAYRLAHFLHAAGVPMIPRILTEHAHSRTGIDIHPAARIGERFFIDHGTGVVIGATTDIGDDVKLYQGVTLGARSVRRDPSDRAPVKRHPTLEDRVTVYAGATILGGGTVVGAGSVIGGNVWLTRSVPPGSTIYRRPDPAPQETA